MKRRWFAVGVSCSCSEEAEFRTEFRLLEDLRAEVVRWEKSFGVDRTIVERLDPGDWEMEVQSFRCGGGHGLAIEASAPGAGSRAVLVRQDRIGSQYEAFASIEDCEAALASHSRKWPKVYRFEILAEGQEGRRVIDTRDAWAGVES